MEKVLSRRPVSGSVDPGGVGECGWFGWFAREPFGSGGVGGVEDLAPCGADLRGASVVTSAAVIGAMPACR
jgi:hypothetical protein